MTKLFSRRHLPLTFIFMTFCLTGFRVQAQTDTSHYVLPEFAIGSVKMKDGHRETAVMDYNKLTEEMIFEKNGILLALDSLEAIDTVYLDSHIFVPHQKVFYELLVRGPVSLFVQHKCNLLAAGNPSGYGGKSETGASRNLSSLTSTGRAYKLSLPSDYHVTDATQYWMRKSGIYYKCNTVSQVSKAFPDKSKEIKEYVKTNKLDIRKTNDLIKLILKCNELAR